MTVNHPMSDLDFYSKLDIAYCNYLVVLTAAACQCRHQGLKTYDHCQLNPNQLVITAILPIQPHGCPAGSADTESVFASLWIILMVTLTVHRCHLLMKNE